MKFGSVRIEAAVGSILAHSVPLAKGRLRKGIVLTAECVITLRDAGHTDIVVATLEAGDVPEDIAAARLAKALVPDPDAAQIDIGPAATGRVNLRNTNVGLVEVDVDAINAANAVNGMITIATLPQWQQVPRFGGGQIATVKIISYAVPEADVQRACDAARGAIRMRAPKMATASLIQTVVGQDDGSKGYKAVPERLDRLNVEMTERHVVAHETATLAEVIRASTGDLILILTASATSDILDTAPAAVVAAGGTVTHFGMPVDPGNLLFLGQVDGKPVIGLPGCARSPALNGADWILERVVCGVPVTSADIAGMGVGGLLKEIPTRPHPRGKIA